MKRIFGDTTNPSNQKPQWYEERTTSAWVNVPVSIEKLTVQIDATSGSCDLEVSVSADTDVITKYTDEAIASNIVSVEVSPVAKVRMNNITGTCKMFVRAV